MAKNPSDFTGYKSGIHMFLERNASPRNLLVLFVIILIFNFFLFPVLMPSGEEAAPMDIMFTYDSEKAYDMIELYGEEGRRSYIRGLAFLDFIYPVVYSLFLGFIIFKIYKRPLPALIPLSILVSDYLENTGIIIMLISWPSRLFILAWLTSLMTSIKWVLTGISVLAIVLGLLSRLRIK